MLIGGAWRAAEDGATFERHDSVTGTLASRAPAAGVARALAVARRIESGICHVNGPTVHDEAQMPFGGVKPSGYGRFDGAASIAEFIGLRRITAQTAPRAFPI
ncbi:hypothetical protein WT60_26005 [Burkholderia sp. MSMB617WGS]|uniref:Aldehyde dehydrogenase domain-containing protein n=1 Tax=Burkholderia savannae TaxID=1637837 RepID=A0ABR5T5L8_9BURK|nr:hypothetical protein WS78_23845 [Burkholderia savannae]AOK50280.1 hypothetical protein WT60_26005 [Burkholderia sp. MSMB617WGS]KVG38181.1 hypothetical protein WS77_21080 [Burkholderia sp. MSMB0265]KVG81353.1 hypothetical protein WS81_11870 [Burkholderia sp. MSMB2040]KVG91782.1 hypothetical protein WS82_13340 [Burkholderia sp. MSMB2041]KVG94343.1 hypothetical protein WS83_07430 [Burkholderia sp. MSMB2042]KVK81852.1 hypothetical protein WS91_10690 [Burkholderia sp. MSMB1498]